MKRYNVNGIEFQKPDSVPDEDFKKWFNFFYPKYRLMSDSELLTELKECDSLLEALYITYTGLMLDEDSKITFYLTRISIIKPFLINRGVICANQLNRG